MVIFKDRREAGKKLAGLLSKKKLNRPIIVSLLRGGAVIGGEISKKLEVKHLILAVAKIPAPFQKELAIGALCYDFTYLDPRIINSLKIDKQAIRKQIKIAKEKFDVYQKKFKLKKSNYKLKNKTVIIVDDGVATGSTIKASLLFIKNLEPKKIVLALPVAPTGFEITGFKNVFILHYDTEFSSVSQFYRDFPQIENEDILRLLR